MPIMGGISNVARNLKGMVGVNNVARKIKKGFYGDGNGVARQFYKSTLPPVKVASNVTSGTFDISQYRLKNTDNFIIDVKNGDLNCGRTLRNVSITVSKSISGNTLTVSAKTICTLGDLYWEGSFTFDIWYIEDPTNRYLGNSPVDITGKSNNIVDYACEPQYCSGYSASPDYTGGRISRSISGNTLTATATVYSSRDLATSNSKIYYLA